MQLPVHIAQQIRDVIARGNIKGLPPYHIDNVARGNDAIALVGDIGGITMLRADGSFWEVDVDSGNPLAPLPDKHIHIALVYGAKKYPWLSELLPKRSKDSIDCAICSGGGMLFPAGSIGGFCCPDCSGLGWRIDASPGRP